MALPLCVIGCGSIGLRHAQQALEATGVRLSAVVEPFEARRQELADMGLPVVASLDDVPEETRAAVIASPTGDHLSAGLAALARGWAVLVEKPLTPTLAEADELIAAAEAAGLPLFTGYHRRCHPFVTGAMDRMDQIGPLVAVQGLWSLRKHDSYYDPEWRRSKGAGPIQTNLSHEVDLLQAMAGRIVEVSALSANAARGLAIEDTAAIALRFESGALGTFLLSDAGASPWAFEAASNENPAIAASGQDAMRLIGTKGALSFPSLEVWTGPEGVDWTTPLSRAPGPAAPSIDPIRAQLERFARAIETGGDPVLATGQDGRASVAVLSAVERAIETGATVSVAAD